MSNSIIEDTGPGLRKSDVDPNPFKQFARWYDEALGADLILPNAHGAGDLHQKRHAFGAHGPAEGF